MVFILCLTVTYLRVKRLGCKPDHPMFKNYFKTATRSLSKNKFFTTLNVFGLAVGMSLSLLFVAMVVFVYQFDNFHPNTERIYRVITHVQDRSKNPSFAS